MVEFVLVYENVQWIVVRVVVCLWWAIFVHIIIAAFEEGRVI